WDYDLFRVLPRVLAARDGVAAERALVEWIDGLGAVAPCDPCAAPPAEGPIRPRLEWLDDPGFAGPDLRDRLRRIHANRLAAPDHAYVGLGATVSNPDFGDEAAYPGAAAPDEGFRLLALYRFWNIIEYWFPYRDLLEENWDHVLREFVPRILEARSGDEYLLELIALSARIHDTHANLHASLHVLPPRGDCSLPVALRPVGDRFVVAHPADSSAAAEGALKRGDIVLAIDGRPVDSLFIAWAPLYAASNEAARRRDVARFLGRGECDSVRLTIERTGRRLEVTARRGPSKTPGGAALAIHDHRGAAFRRLSQDLAYLTLSGAKADEMPDHVRRAAGAKCLVIDIRNYPSEFVVFALGRWLVGGETPFVRFTVCDPANPGAFVWRVEPLRLTPAESRFEGRVAILVDEVTQSQAEYHAMAFRTAPGAVVVGSTTAGADGNVSPIPLPGGARGMISGLGVYYPDRRPTQRIGILPDLRVLPTVEGIREGRDEVLEAAVRHVLGREMSREERRALAPDAVR
ncbi:MAG TPA: S41 family peptidase, partial [Candidatus Eisenbacteria bacterium]|nr:S41 family peptidase [Candidatus Eisenbacteria bacterium]